MLQGRQQVSIQLAHRTNFESFQILKVGSGFARKCSLIDFELEDLKRGRQVLQFQKNGGRSLDGEPHLKLELNERLQTSQVGLILV